MKRFYVFLVIALTAFGAMSCQKMKSSMKRYYDKYIVYESMPLYERADVRSDVVGEAQADQTKFINIKRYSDNKHKYGIVKDYVHDKKQWIHLEEINCVAPCGSEDPHEVSDRMVVVPNELKLRSRPAKTGGQTTGTLHRGDTLRVLARYEGWAHIEFLRYDKEGRHAHYGWVEETPANLLADGTTTQREYDFQAIARYSSEELWKARRKTGELWLDHKPMAVLHKITKITLYIAAYLSLLLGIFLWISDGSGHMVWGRMLILSLVLQVFAYNTHNPHWIVAVAPLMVTFVLLFPLVRTRLGGLFPHLYWIITSAWVLAYIYLYIAAQHIHGGELIIQIFIFGFMAFAELTAVVYLTQNLRSHTCPKCGFFGPHDEIDRQTILDSVSGSSGRKNVKVGEEKIGDKRIIYYDTVMTHETNYHYTSKHIMECCHCGHVYDYETWYTKTTNS